MKDSVSIQELGSLGDEEKNALVSYCRAAFRDEALTGQKSVRKSITLAREDRVTYKLVAEQEEKKMVKTVEDSVSELGLSGEAAKKILKEYKARDIKKYHVTDIKYLSDLLQILEPARQKKAIDFIIRNRKDLYHINKEDVVLLLADENRINPYFAEVWYNGLIRTLDKLKQKIDVPEELLAAVDPIYRKDVKRKMKPASEKLLHLKSRL